MIHHKKYVFIHSIILITGMFLQISCSIINVSSANPDINGKSTSVNMRSTLLGLPLNISHAFKPSDTAATAQTTKKKKKIVSVSQLTCHQVLGSTTDIQYAKYM